MDEEMEKAISFLREVVVLWSHYILKKDTLSNEEQEAVSDLLIGLTPFAKEQYKEQLAVPPETNAT